MRYGPVILIVLLLVSCELVTEVDVPGVPAQLVVNGLFQPDSTFRVVVSASRHILASQPTTLSRKTVVTITRNDGQVLTLDTAAVEHDRLWFTSTARAEAGRTYTLRVSSPGFEDIQATAQALPAIDLIDVHLDSANMIPYSYNTVGSIPIEFTFQDPASLADYYIPTFAIFQQRHVRNEDGTYTLRTVWTRCFLTEAVEAGEFSNLDGAVGGITDEGFNGKLHTVRLHVNKSFWSSNEPKAYSWKFELLHVTEDYYRYQRSVRLQNEVDGNPFAQPVQVYSNIEGGFGLFAGVSASVWIHE